MNIKLLFLSVVAALALSACATKDENLEQAPAEASVESNLPQECEYFLSQYETCINDRAPAQQRDALNGGLTQMRLGLEDALVQGADKAAMAEGCKQALEQVKPMLEPMGCKF